MKAGLARRTELVPFRREKRNKFRSTDETNRHKTCQRRVLQLETVPVAGLAVSLTQPDNASRIGQIGFESSDGGYFR